MTLYSYQDAGIAWLRSRQGAILADDMGLGKTRQSIMAVAPLLDAGGRVLVICPATLKINWAREFQKWISRNAVVLSGRNAAPSHEFAIVICNYDIVANAKLDGKWDAVILDEAHYTKNLRAARTKAIHKLEADRFYLLTGTPIVNRPIELWSLLLRIGAVKADKFWAFARRYCGAQQVRLPGRFGRVVWDFSSATNLAELRDKISPYLLRRTKDEVLKDLPPLTHQTIEVDAGESERRLYASLPASVLENIDEIRARAASNEHLAVARHKTGLEKIADAVELILDTVVENNEKIVVFAHHRDVLAGIKDALRAREIYFAEIAGDVSMSRRQDAVDAFQTGSTPVMLCQTTAGGVGITLTAASEVLVVEPDWTPANLAQAVARCHRIGASRPVRARYLVAPGTPDEIIVRTAVNKQDIIDTILGERSPQTIEEIEDD